MFSRLPAPLPVLVLALCAISTAAADSEDVLAKALTHEERWEFTEAWELLQAASPEPGSAAAKHAGALAGVLRAREGAELYVEDGRFAEARAMLEKVLPDLDPVRDLHLVRAVHRQLAGIEKRIRRSAEKEARQDLRIADRLVQQGELSESLALYAEVAAVAGLPPELARQARQGQERVQAAKARAEAPGFWRKTWDAALDSVRTILVWSACIGMGGLVVGLVRGGRRRFGKPREGTGLWMEDWTAEPERRDSRSQSLTRELWRGIYQADRAPGRPADLDPFEDLDGAGLGSLRVEVSALDQLADVIPEGSPVQLGPFSLNPRQLLAYLRSFFHQPSKILLKGALSVQDGKTVLFVERIDNEKGDSQDRWEAPGEETRARAIQGMAVRIAFELAQKRVTPSWESFHWMREGMSLLQQELDSKDREKTLADAAVLFQRSLRQDPANWLARFNLATVQRKLGRNDTAAEHFELLEKHALRRGGESLKGFLGEHPEFPYTLRYNRLVALSKASGERAAWTAALGLSELIAALAGSEEKVREEGGRRGSGLPPVPRAQLDPKVRLRLELLARSAYAAALSNVMDQQGESRRTERKEGDKTRQALVKTAQQIREIVSWIDGLQEPPGDLWRDYHLACAVIYNAHGRASFLVGTDRLALKALQKAIAFEPELVDAHVNLAQVLLRQGGAAELQQAEERLEQALRISPSNQKIHYLLGKLYSHPLRGDYKKAREHLEKARLFEWSYVLRAQIHAERDQDLPAAIDCLRRALSMNPTPDFRYVKLLEHVLRLAKKGGASEDLLRESIRRSDQLTRRGRTANLQGRGAELQRKLREALAQLSRKPAPAEKETTAQAAAEEPPPPDAPPGGS